MNVFLDLPMPVGVGVGTAVDVSALGPDKTINVDGSTFENSVISIEISLNGTEWDTVTSYQGTGGLSLVQVSCGLMRVRVAGSAISGVAASVAAPSGVVNVEALDVPPGNGNGASSDISGFGRVVTAQVGGTFNGPVISIDVSNDGSTWAQAFNFSETGFQTLFLTSKYARVRVHGKQANMPYSGVTVSLAASSDTSGASPMPTPFVSPTEVITIYARTTGDDAIGSGTLVSPYRTFQRCLLDVPLFIPAGVRYIIDISGIGTEILPNNFELPAFKSSEAWDFTFDNDYTSRVTALRIFAQPTITSAVPPADAVVTLADVASMTADADTGLITITLNAPRASWGANALKGKFIKGTGGILDLSVIASSTTTTLEITSIVAPTTPLQINDLSAELQSGGDFGVSAFNVDSVDFVGIKFNNPDGGADFITANNGGLTLHSCDFKGIDVEGSAGFFMTLYNCYWHDYFGFFTGGIGFYKSFAENTFVTLSVPGGYFRIGHAIMDGCSSIEWVSPAGFEVPSSVAPGCLVVDNAELRNSTGDAIVFHGVTGTIYQTRIANSVGNAITFNKGSGCLQLNGVVGTGNGGVGVQVTDGAQVMVDVNTIVTGTGGDMQVGNMAVRTWADFRANPPVDNQADFTGATATGSRLFQP